METEYIKEVVLTKNTEEQGDRDFIIITTNSPLESGENVIVERKFTDSEKPVLCLKNEYSDITEENTYEMYPFQNKIIKPIPKGTLLYTLPSVYDKIKSGLK